MTHVDSLLSIGLLYNPDGGIGNQDQEDDERFHKSSHPASTRFRRILKQSQDKGNDS